MSYLTQEQIDQLCRTINNASGTVRDKERLIAGVVEAGRRATTPRAYAAMHLEDWALIAKMAISDPMLPRTTLAMLPSAAYDIAADLITAI